MAGVMGTLVAGGALCEPAKAPVEERAQGIGLRGLTTKKWYFYKGRPSSEEGAMDNMVVFGGSIYPELAGDICNLLGIAPGKIKLGRYADGECSVLIKDPILGKDVFIVTPTHTNDSLVELLLITSAAKRASAGSVVAVIPFYGYARQDRRFRREPIAAADVAHMLEAMGVDRIITVDLHSGQIQGFFGPCTPVDHLSPMGVAAAYFAEMVAGELGISQVDEYEYDQGAGKTGTPGGYRHSREGNLGLGEEESLVEDGDVPKIVVVAPQEGQVGRANNFKGKLQARLGNIPVSLAFIARSTTLKADEEEEETYSYKEEVHKHCIGDVKGALCIIVDDLVDTAGTLENAVNLLTAAGASKIIAFATHGRFSGDGEARVMQAKGLERLVICNTLPHRNEDGELKNRLPSDKVRELSVAPLLAEAVYRVHKRIPFAELLMGSNTTSTSGGVPKGLAPRNAVDPPYEEEGKGEGKNNNH